MSSLWTIEEDIQVTDTLRVFVEPMPVIAPAHFLRAQGKYAHTAPSFSDVSIPISNISVLDTSLSPIANRQVVGELLVGQRIDVMATSCWAARYTLTASISAAGVLEYLFISSPDCVVGPGTAPTVTLINAAPNLTMRFYNFSLTGNVTGVFELKLGWAT